MLQPGTLPYLTHERFLILSLVLTNGGSIRGEDLRAKLAARGWTPSQPGFSQIMTRMERSKILMTEYAQKIVNGAAKRERIYAITQKGTDAHVESIKFYEP
jgi:DNA-binding PadR family transcriptional regulator